ncbi:hypothetical protein AB0I37_24900 [Micromonospora purpureochromogenes]|uniref:hypothetical protein n=1 Tax=Micromonospora purpureochromogenes TaxID=47872 RepID=UPI0033D0543B
MAKSALTFTLRIDGARETLAALRKLPKDANNELRQASLAISRAVAEKAKAAGAREGGQAAAVARTVRAQRDRVPAVVAGGTRRLGRHKTPAFNLLFASEFGQNRRTGWYAAPKYAGSAGRQYRPHRGRQGIWFFPTVEAEQADIARRWQQAADEVIEKFGEG